MGFRQSLHALLSAFAISGAILGSVAPVTFFLAVNVPAPDSPEAVSAHSGYLLAHVLLIGLAGVTGVVRLGKLLESYCRTKVVARMTLGAWLAGNAFLGMQFSWILRPFFGSPGLEVAFLRDDPMRGSFIETVWRSVGACGRRAFARGLVFHRSCRSACGDNFSRKQKSQKETETMNEEPTHPLTEDPATPPPLAPPPSRYLISPVCVIFSRRCCAVLPELARHSACDQNSTMLRFGLIAVVSILVFGFVLGDVCLRKAALGRLR